MSRRLTILGVTCVLTTFVATPAVAQNEPTADEKKQAKEHFERAKSYEGLEDYERAAEEYLAAYAVYPEPEFQFNAGEMYRLDGQPAKALEHFERYLALEPNGRGAPAARQAIAELKESLPEAADEAAGRGDEGADGDVDPDPEPQEPVPVRPADGRAPSTFAGPETGPAQPPRDAAGGGSGLRLAGIGTAALGVALLGGGVYYGLEARSISDEASDWDTFDAERYDEGEAAERNALILSGVGVSAVVAGGIMYWLGRSRGADDGELAIAPTARPGSVGITIVGGF